MIEFDEVSSLPKSWEVVSLGDVIELKYGKSLTKLNRHGDNYPVYGSNGIIGFHSNFIVENPCLVVGRKGSIGEIHISENSCYPIDTTYYIDEFYEQPVNYWLYRLKALPLGQLNRASAVPGLNRKDAYKIQIPLPPLNEQRRIVAKIEALKARSQWVKEAIAAIPPLLDQFRQSVLAAAFRGDLTADWREKNPDVEPASVLLDRIRAERRRRWEEAELEKMKANGKIHTDNKWKSKYKGTVAPDLYELPDLPKGWCWATFEQVSERVTVGHVGSMKDEYIKNGIPFLRSQNVRENRFDPEGLQFISRKFHEYLRKSSLQPGDLVVVRSGSVGVACVIPETLKEANCSDLIIVKQPQAINPHYGAFYMNSIARSHVNAKQVGVALNHFNTKSMADLPIAVPPLAEQKEILRHIQNLFKSADQIEQQYQEIKAHVDQLDQSILAKAFRGELVPQDPNDEPASMLLERIKAERGKREAEAKAAKNTNKTSGRRSRKQQPDSESTQLKLPGLE